MGILDRVRRRLRRRADAPLPPGTPGDTELGLSRLADGTVLERCVVATAADVQAALRPGRRDRLIFLFSADDPASAHDLHELRELHLYYSQQLDWVSVALDRAAGAPLRDAALAVDAFHRDHGLTWQSLVLDAAPPPALAAEGLPLVRLLRPDGAVAFERRGAWAGRDRAALERALTDRGDA